MNRVEKWFSISSFLLEATIRLISSALPSGCFQNVHVLGEYVLLDKPSAFRLFLFHGEHQGYMIEIFQANVHEAKQMFEIVKQNTNGVFLNW